MVLRAAQKIKGGIGWRRMTLDLGPTQANQASARPFVSGPKAATITATRNHIAAT